MKTKTSLLAAALLLLSAAALAGFLPLWYDVPKRDNPNDPFVKRQNGDSLLAPTTAPTAQPTPVCLGGADNSLFSFEDGLLDGWNSSTAGGYTLISGIANGTSPACNGSKAICGSITLTHGGAALKANFNNPYVGSLSGRKLTAAAYFPAGMSTGATQMKMYIKSTASYVYSNGASVNVPAAGGWVGLSFDLSQAPVYTSGVTDTSQVKEIGLELYSPSTEANGTFTICMDSWDDGPNPTPTMTPTITPTFTPGAPTATATPCSSSYAWGFDDNSVDGWSAANAGASLLAPNTAFAHDCSYSLAFNADLTDGNASNQALINIDLSASPLDLTGKTITAWLYVPAGMSPSSSPNGWSLFVQCTSGQTWTDSGWQNLPATAGWIPLSFNVSAIANINQVYNVGLKIGRGGTTPPLSGTFYLDSVNY